jgi:hypothetical protein
MKSHHHNSPIHPGSNARSVIHEAIATRAYDLWLEQGKPENRAEQLWLQAERELAAEKSAMT